MLEYSCPPQTQSRKRKTVDADAERPLKRAHLTEENLEAFNKMVGPQRTSSEKYTGQSYTGQSFTAPPTTSTTDKNFGKKTKTTDKNFGTKLQRNNVVYIAVDAQAAGDVAEIRELLNQRRASEPPDQLAYNRYLTLTEDHENERTVEFSVYTLLSKRTAQREVSGYFPRLTHPWSEVDNHLTKGLSNACPDIVESYRKTDYPSAVVEALSGDLAPSSYNEAMPTYAVEFKSPTGDMKEAQWQCAYDGAIMTEGAFAVHKHLGKSDKNFYHKTQALTVAFNGENIKFYGHHALQIPLSPQPGGGVDSSAGITASTVGTRQYHQYRLASDNPRDSLEDFQSAYKHIRNAEDIGFEWATERKAEMWVYTNGNNTQTPPDVPTSAR